MIRSYIKIYCEECEERTEQQIIAKEIANYQTGRYLAECECTYCTYTNYEYINPIKKQIPINIEN